MVTLHAFEALFAGFAVTVLLSFAATLLLKQLAPQWAEETSKLSVASILANLGSSFLASAAGGYTTAWIAAGNALSYALVLGMIVLVLAGLGALQRGSKQPMTYQLASVAIAPLGVLAGGLLRLRVAGIL